MKLFAIVLTIAVLVTFGCAALAQDAKRPDGTRLTPRYAVYPRTFLPAIAVDRPRRHLFALGQFCDLGRAGLSLTRHKATLGS
jgi:hypothetical protein